MITQASALAQIHKGLKRCATKAKRTHASTGGEGVTVRGKVKLGSATLKLCVKSNGKRWVAEVDGCGVWVLSANAIKDPSALISSVSEGAAKDLAEIYNLKRMAVA